MKLPNDLIKATDYSKAKDREIHEFEYRNGKYIHKYALGGEHELTPQEVVDCLNGLTTIDCDLQTAYAFIQGQEEKISNLEAKLAESEKKLNQYPYKNDVIEKQYEELKNGIKFRIENNINDDWEQHYHCIDVLCEKHKARIRDIEKIIGRIEELEKHNAWVQEFLEKYQINTELTPEYSENPIIEYCEQVNDFRAVDNKIIEDLQNELAESEKQIKHLKDWLDDEILTSIDHESYYDTINEYEEEIKQLKQQLEEKDKEIKDLNTRIFISQLLQTPEEQRLKIIGNSCCQYNPNQDKISFAVEQLEKVKKYSNEKFEWWENREWEIGVFEKTDVSNAYFDIEVKVDDLIEELKKETK